MFLRDAIAQKADPLYPANRKQLKILSGGGSVFGRLDRVETDLADQVGYHKYCHRVLLTQTIETSRRTRGFTQRAGGGLFKRGSALLWKRDGPNVRRGGSE